MKLKTKKLIILGIETSCDDTAIALLEATGELPLPDFKLLKNIISSQESLHSEYGGIVPGLAKREHSRNLVKVFYKTLSLNYGNSKFQIPNSKQITKSKIKTIEKILERYPEMLEEFKEKILPLKKPAVDLIAVTYGPGLEPALWVGVNFARALSVLWDIPLIGVDHMEGHIAVNLLPKINEMTNDKIQMPKSKDSNYSSKHIEFPAVALAVSGGHTQLILVKNWMDYELLGETLDDAAGEAFDKVARLLGLGFPGGPAIEQKAAQWKSQNPNFKFQKNSKIQISKKDIDISLPLPMLHSKDLNFSFSGLKTAVLYNYKAHSEKVRKSPEYIEAMSFATQQAIISVLVSKSTKAAKEYKAKTFMLAGGVAANQALKEQMKQALLEQDNEGLQSGRKSLTPALIFMVPEIKLATDNGAMIAIAGWLRYKAGEKSDWRTLEANSSKIITE